MKVFIKISIIVISVFQLACKKVELAVVLPKQEYKPIDTFPKNAFWSPVTSFVNKVPNVYINTKGNTIVNEPKVQSIIQIQLGDTIVFRSNIGIEYRGSTSFRLFDQKSYGIELRDAVDNDTDSVIMDFPKQSDFILYAPANDKALIRNTLIYDLSNQIGMYATRTKYVHLYVDGEYLGLYVLMEKIKRDKSRVNITKMASTDNSGSAITGGYILKIDKSAGDNTLVGWDADAVYTEALGFRSNYDPNGIKINFLPYGPKKSAETYIMYEYPKNDAISYDQKKYVQTYFSDFEDILLSNNYKDPINGYQKFIDVNSFIDFLILNEFAYNPDAYRLSTFMNKERSGKLKMGPIWDFNLGFGNDDRVAFVNGSTWVFNYNNYYPSDTWLVNFWWKKLLSDPTFTDRIKSRWASLRTSSLSEASILLTIDKHINILKNSNSIDKHFDRWKILGVKLPFNNFVGKTHQEEVDFLKSWVKKRLTWMDNEIVKL
jgi:hypothetical protein